ncbi:hypothetical protein SCHPADRAFT_677421 [Schizopora paradoxa]|uniref:Uncharacterized protein n=1 Tax=Schizopora paradoxa TaxID=27342 RepID=A0A0H2R4R7_9AGAM|nr:hypothetical protein SCHPADRAFT_677421 [Schizopora paradoxa]
MKERRSSRVAITFFEGQESSWSLGHITTRHSKWLSLLETARALNIELYVKFYIYFVYQWSLFVQMAIYQSELQTDRGHDICMMK